MGVELPIEPSGSERYIVLAVLWLQLFVAAVIILGASVLLAKSADVIALKTGLGRSFAGVVLLATATSLPELGTGVSAAALVGEPDLAAGAAFGSNLFNLFIIGLLDILWWNRPILNHVGITSVVIGALGIAVMCVAIIAVYIHGTTDALSSSFVSPVSMVIFLMFVAAMFIIYRFEKDKEGFESGPVETPQYEDSSLLRAVVTYAVAATIVVGAAVWLSGTADQLAEEMGWQASFMGTQFLAGITSLPELATSIAALRLNAPELAITNLLGSNLFNMGLVLFLDDLAYTEGVLWSGASQIHLLTGVLGILMTTVIIMALVSRPRSGPDKAITAESVLLTGMYVAAGVLVFKLG